ncbi:MAG: S16 family serine protease [Pseudomonadota bacterium]
MLPFEFDHQFLDSLPWPDEDDVKRVISILRTIVLRRVMQYFKKTRGTDAIAASRVAKDLEIVRLEDPGNRIRCLDIVAHKDGKWVLSIHERVFDYLAFVIPTRPESRLGDGTAEERKMLAFSEFLLRHEVEHMLYPLTTERDMCKSDVAFAMDKRANDPTFYRELRRALSDEMNGLRGRRYLELFDAAEQEASYDGIVTEILNDYGITLADFPLNILGEIFPGLQTELQSKVLGTCYKRSRDTSYSLIKRTSSLRKLLRVFDRLADTDAQQAEVVLNAFKDRWGLVFLLHELGVPETSVEDKDSRQLFDLLRRALKEFSDETEGIFHTVRTETAPLPKPAAAAVPLKSLKDRIEDARNDAAFPQQVMEVIDKNKLNAVGHSGAKYSELIETLLAIPWGNIRKIGVTPEAFEKGLDLSHYGLKRPKEIICDFFSNLIWRYRQSVEGDGVGLRKSGSAFLFVGPPGVGKTSLAISIAENLGIPYHKLSLGGMRDEADLRGHGFTYEGSKPGAIVQGLIKMGVVNGMFIMDEADKTEKFAIATLLEILDPEQNHLFHDKFTQSTVDVDLSSCHFILTANTLDTVPPPVVNRCEVVQLDRYSVDEKVSIAREHLIDRVRNRHSITEDLIAIDPEEEEDLLRHIIKAYTHEPGVRELERVIRTLFLRIMRKEILGRDSPRVTITRQRVKEFLDPPQRLRVINEDDRVGEMTALGVNVERGIGAIIPVQATAVRSGDSPGNGKGYLSMVHATGNIAHIMDESRKVAATAILHCADALRIDLERAGTPIHLHFMGGSTPKDGPSAGGAIALALASVLSGRKIRRDVAMTGEIDTQGRITTIGGLDVKLETAYDAGCKTVIIPRENLYGAEGIERLSDALQQELQVLDYDQWKGPHEPFDPERQILEIVAVDHITQAAEIALINDEVIKATEMSLVPHGRRIARLFPALSEVGRPHFNVVYTKAPWELDLLGPADEFWDANRSYFLVPAAAGKELADQFPVLKREQRLWHFDPGEMNVADTLTEMAKHFRVRVGDSYRCALTAPFFFLKRDLKTLSQFSPGSAFERFRLFGNNYALQGVKIKSCKTVLNRVCYYLAQLSDEELRDCPFMAKWKDIYVVDLSFIPEALLLDASRAARLLEGSLKRWLAAVEGREFD